MLALLILLLGILLACVTVSLGMWRIFRGKVMDMAQLLPPAAYGIRTWMLLHTASLIAVLVVTFLLLW
jgi:hypothetical protein